jgi:hypothetical protein
MTDPDNLTATYENHQQALEKANEINKTAVFDALSVAAISTVTAEFDGEGDSGQIEAITACRDAEHVALPDNEVTLYRASWEGNALVEVNTPLREAIETLCYAYLEQYQGGWENDDGAFGSFAFDVARRTIALEFNGRFTDIATHNYDL